MLPQPTSSSVIPKMSTSLQILNSTPVSDSVECVKPELVNALLKHPEVSLATKKKLRVMLKNIENENQLAVSYGTMGNTGFGPLLPDKGMGLQALPPTVRNSCCTRYHQVSLVDPEVACLLHLAKHHGWVATHTQQLYDQRELTLRRVQEECKLGDDAGKAEQVVMGLQHHAGLLVEYKPGWPVESIACGEDSWQPPEPLTSEAFVVKWQQELRALAANVAASYPKVNAAATKLNQRKKRLEGEPQVVTTLGLVVASLQTNMLTAMWSHLQQKHYRPVACLLRDGLLIDPMSNNEETVADSLLQQCRAAITAATGVNTTVVQVSTQDARLDLDEYMIGSEDQQEPPKDPYCFCRDMLLDNAESFGHIRMAGTVWEPVPNTVCAYQLHQEYTDYINSVLEAEPHFHNDPNLHDKLMKWLRQYQHQRFLKVAAPDRSLLSFKNGTYILPSDKFVEHTSPEAVTLRGKVARNHIDLEFTGSTATPMFDELVTYQVPDDPEAYRWYLVMLGRLQYRVKELDNWQAMLYVYGAGGTGKSTAINIYTRSFNKAAIQELGSHAEKTFGMEKLASPGVELITCLDVPSDAPASDMLPQDKFLRMVAGEPVPVAFKGGVGKTVKIDSPLIMVGNEGLRYNDSRGQIMRRLVMWYHTRYVARDKLDPTLENRIVAAELPALIKRSNQEYLRESRTNGDKDIWALLPEYYHTVRDEQGTGTLDPLKEFLEAPRPTSTCEVTRHYVVFQEKAVTCQEKLVEALAVFMQVNHSNVKTFSPGKYKGVEHFAPCIHKGYIRDATMMVCNSCLKPHKAKPKKCCTLYHPRGRTTKVVWKNMLLVEVPPIYHAAPDEGDL